MKRVLLLLILLPAAAALPAPAQQIIMGGGGRIFFGGMGGGPQTDAEATAPAPGEPPVLRWKNGDALHGEIAAATAGDISWKSPFFEDPLQLRWDVVDRIDWPAVPVQPTGPFGIALRDGSFIYGDVVSVTADSILIHSTSHGDAALKRSEVLSARRLSHGSLIYSGPTGDLGWQPLSIATNGDMATNSLPNDYTPALMTGPDGALLIRTWNRCARFDLKLPDSVDVEFSMRSSKRPDFLLSLGGTPRKTLRVETWDNELVLAMGDDFKTIRKIEDSEREVNLRICWDKKARKCLVFTSAGELIAEWRVPGDASSTDPGLVLENKGLDLSLNFVRVRKWDGETPPKTDPKHSRVELADGRCVGGAIAPGASPGTVHLQAPGQTGATDVPLSDVDALVFSSDPPQISSHETTLLYNDGAILYGTLDSIANGRAAIATSFSEKPLPAPLDILRQLLIRAPVTAGTVPDGPSADQDKILVGQTNLHGKLGTTPDGSLGWIPVGGVKASRPSKSLPSQITRYIPPDMPAPTDPALFYLNSGDILPGTLGSMDRSGAEFESSLMPARKIPAAELNAIKFGASDRLNVQGFGDPGWHIIKGDESTVQRMDDKIQMTPGTAIIYPSLMESSEISFKFVPSGLSSARLRMFCSKDDPKHGTNLLLGCTGNQFISGLETTEGQFDNQTQINTTPGQSVSVRIEIGEYEVELFVNDVSQQRIPIDPAKLAGFDLIIEPASIWGNNSFPLSLSSFSARSGPGRAWLPEVSGEIESQVLTVPRFQKDDPPRHLLLAENGDVLRGEIEAATATHFRFRCGLENLNVPRDRVAAVIWLKPPETNPDAAAAEAAAAEKTAPNPLDDRIPGRAIFNRVQLGQIISFVQSQDRNLKFKLPENPDQRTVRMTVGNQTVGQALERICSQFNFHYRIDGDGTIILEPGDTQPSDDLAFKSYWLKPGAISETPSAQEILTAKGITFPKGASVAWEPNGGLLSMSNTPENQTKLAALLASDFGGSLGSPTHWLQLTDGARIALAVDKIGQDYITGHHPVYGAVKIPMAQVYVIRTTAPEPSAAIKSLENWRLVNAPEPVIPEGSGESSPLVGKDAITFKLPLLDGGDFNLDNQKGQVVVLDFWATWCGPCIQSLPGLIDAIASFPADRVKLIGVNQGEAPDKVKHFLESRGMKLIVAMDTDQAVAQKYGVDAIPHTVIVGPDGKVAWVQTGYNPDGETEASDTIKRLLAPAPPANHL
ncbi:MAG TPA: redoxin domain-containing protein [Candidatus Methylacidiphilales bacterium]|jgi:peroxiredoxin|nr:redoxin domain-containing protein [Candidatus Methylacidiphilales bacterium]